jgi:hypothetical protein
MLQRSMLECCSWARAVFFVVNQLTSDTNPQFLYVRTGKILLLYGRTGVPDTRNSLTRALNHFIG